LAAVFLFDVDDFLAPTGKQVVDIIRSPMKLLRSHHQVDIGQAID